MTEAALVRRILRDLRAAGACAVKVHGSPFMEAGTPDILGCYRGRALAIECKVGRNRPSPVQEARLAQWRASGAAVTVARENFNAHDWLRASAFQPPAHQ